MFSGATSVCTAECCTNLDGANQPTAQCILAKTKVKVGRQCRTFQSTWYKSYPWITLCETSGRVFCHVCRHSCITMSKQSEPAFTASGFFNWRRAIERFKIHEQSLGHKEAVMKLSHTNQPTVDAQLSSQHARDQTLRRGNFLKQLSSLRLLLRQGLAIRGHEEHEGNLYQLLQVRCEDDKNLLSWLQAKRYNSPEILNES